MLTFPAPWLQLILPMHLLLLLVEGVLLSLLKLRFDYLGRIYLPVFSSLWQRRDALLALRRLVMTSRRLTSQEFFAVFDVLPHKLRMLLRHGLPRVT